MRSARLALLLVLLFAATSVFAQNVAKGKSKDDGTAATQPAADDNNLRQPTKDEVQELTSGLERSLSQPTDMPVTAVGNGIYKIDLDGTHEDVALAKIGPDGKVVVGCVDSMNDAKAFLTRGGKRNVPALAKAAVRAALSAASKPAVEWEEK